MPEQRLIEANKLKQYYSWWGDSEERKVFDDIVDVQPTVNAIVLPCKVGDTVWWMTGRKILKCKVARFQISKYGVAMVLHSGNTKRGLFDACLIGESLFLSSEAAEAALAEREG